MKRDYNQESNQMTILHVHSKQHVIRPFSRFSSIYPEPNYNNTGCALVGVLKKGQTFESFKKDWVKLKSN